MKEIKFRGKRIINGEWVYGNLIQYEDGSNPCIMIALSGNVSLAFEVFPDSVGQFTGLYDINKKESFVDDLIRFEYEGQTKVGRIAWEFTGWHVIFDEYDYISLAQLLNAFEIIGTIHETQEQTK